MNLNLIFYPNFCPFLLLKYNKEAGKNFSYSDTLYAIDLEALRESYLNSKKLRL